MPTLTDKIFRRTSAVLKKLNMSGGGLTVTQIASSSSDTPEISPAPNSSSIEKIKKFIETFSGKFLFNPVGDEPRRLNTNRDDISGRSTLQRLRTDLKKGPVGWIEEMDSALASLLLAPQLTEQEGKEKAAIIADRLSSLNGGLSLLFNFKKVYGSHFFKKDESMLDSKEVTDFNEAVKLIAEKQPSQTAASSSQSEEIQLQDENTNVLVFNQARKEINDLMQGAMDSNQQAVQEILTKILNYLETREILFSRRILLCHLSGLSNPICDQYYIGGREDPLEKHGDIYPYYLRTLDSYLADFLQAISQQLSKTRSHLQAIDIIKLIQDFEIKATVLNDLLSKRYYMARKGAVLFLFYSAVVFALFGFVLALTTLAVSITAAALGIIASGVGTLALIGGLAAGCLLVALCLALPAWWMENQSRRNHEKKFFSTEVKIDDLNTMVEELGEALSDSEEKPVTTVESASVDQMQTASSEQSIEIDRQYIPGFQRNDKELEERISKTRQLVIERLLNNKNTFFAQNDAEKLQASCGDAPQIGVSAA